jgi:DNA repair protein RecO (recombination protein O)
LKQTNAIILRMHAWSETSLVGSIFTREHGKVSVLAKGARRPKSPFEAALDLLSVCRVVFIEKSSDSLNLLTEAKLVRRFRNENRCLLRLYSAYYVAEMLEQFTQQGEQQPAEIYELAAETLGCLEQSAMDFRAVVLRFEMQMLRLAGLMPSFQQCVGCGKGITSKEWLIYGSVAGGVLCVPCSQGQKQMIRIPAELCDCLLEYGSADWRAIPMNCYPVRWRAVIRAVMEKTISSTIDRRMKLHSYLEELGR